MEHALVLGATNALGCRLAEALVESGVAVTAVVDDWTEAARLARLPVQMLDGLSTDTALGRVMSECDVVFHCAERSVLGSSAASGGRAAFLRVWRRVFGSDGSGSNGSPVERTLEAALTVALANGVRRVIAVRAAQAASPDEAVLQSCRARGVAVTVLRPATIYGPFCPFTIETVRALRANRTPRGGRGACVYVDRVVDAMLIAVRSGTGGDAVRLEDDLPESVGHLVNAHARALRLASPASHETPASVDSLADGMASTARWIEWARL
jgi:nucleoside-diphosphate-sugar epimerase